VDGDLSDFSNDEIVLRDRWGDSYWGLQNEIGNFYMTWDKENFYIGLEYIVKNNALMIIIDVGIPGLQDLDILNFYPRNLKLVGINANYLIALWDADLTKGGFRKIDIKGTTTDLTSSVEIVNNGKSGEKSYIEAKIPFDLIFEAGFSSGSEIKIFACIAGGDHSGSGDIAPDNMDIDGIPPEYVRKFAVIYFDKDFNAVPDSGIEPYNSMELKEVQFEKFEIKEFKIRERVLFTNQKNECSVMVSKTSNLNLLIISEAGKLYKRVYQGTVIANELKTFSFSISDPGIYILLLEIPGKLREKKVLKVIK